MEVTPLSESRILLATSSVTTFASCYLAAYYQLYDSLAVSTVTLVLAINYWRKPMYDWRRTLDISNLILCLIYQFYQSLWIDPALRSLYTTFVFISGVNYALGKTLSGRAATYSHSCMHLTGVIANSILYTGLAREKRKLNILPGAGGPGSLGTAVGAPRLFGAW